MSPAATSTGRPTDAATTGGAAPPTAAASARTSRPRPTMDARPEPPMKTAAMSTTGMVPIASEIGPTTMIGRKLPTDTSMFRIPKTRPRTVLRDLLLELRLGRDRDRRVGDPGHERDGDDDRQDADESAETSTTGWAALTSLEHLR